MAGSSCCVCGLDAEQRPERTGGHPCQAMEHGAETAMTFLRLNLIL